MTTFPLTLPSRPTEARTPLIAAMCVGVAITAVVATLAGYFILDAAFGHVGAER